MPTLIEKVCERVSCRKPFTVPKYDADRRFCCKPCAVARDGADRAMRKVNPRNFKKSGRGKAYMVGGVEFI